MTQPKQHLPGQVVLLTRRTHQRQYLLRPDKKATHLFGYSYFLGCDRHTQLVHGALCMSNHPHSVQTDVSGNRSDFMKEHHARVTRGRNHHLGRQDTLWSSGEPGDCVLLDRDAIERKLLYVWLNPVEAGLVRRVEDWPGFKILPKHWGQKLRIKRPKAFFREDNLPDYVEITPMPPPGYEDMTLEEVRAHFERLIEEGEKRIAEERRRQGKPGVLGARRAMQVDPFSSPETEEPLRTLNPKLASKDPERLTLARQLLHAFIAEYQEARHRFKKGERDVVFPAGTIALRKRVGVRCRAPDPCAPGIMPRAA